MKYSISKKIEHFFLNKFLWIYGCLHKTQKKILFYSFNNNYSDNPRAICEKMHELYPEYRLIWALRSNNDLYHVIPSYVDLVAPKSYKYLKELATAACFVTNGAIRPYTYKGAKQYFIQTWHGDRKFKKIQLEVWDERGKKPPIPVIENRVVDLCVAGSTAGVELFHNAFHYDGEVICFGCPRNDQLVIPSIKKKVAIKKTLAISEDTKVLLYAPTFRDKEKGKQKANLDLNSVLAELNKKEENWICLVRAHSATMGLLIETEEKDKFRDVTNYPDMADLLLVTDFLITDYSSCACDFILTNKPVVLYISDIDEYQRESRSLQYNPEDTGFILARNSKEMIDILSNTTAEQFLLSDEKVKKFYGVCETGKSAEKICKKIAQHGKSINL